MPTLAEELLKDGKPDEALAALQAEVRAKPADARLRVFLFQLLVIQGQWDRALTQLNVAAELNPKAQLMAQACRPALLCEALRVEVFEGKRLPVALGEPAEWMAWMMQAARLTGQGEHAAAADLRQRALDAAPTVAGTVDGHPFEWLADADTRLGPILEAVIDGRYSWVPMSNLAAIELERPVDLRDVVWAPATLRLAGGGQKVAMIPARYPGSEADPDPAVRLARKTEWTELAPGTFAGRGQRLFATDGKEYPILQIGRIVFGSWTPEESAAPAAEARG